MDWLHSYRPGLFFAIVFVTRPRDQCRPQRRCEHYTNCVMCRFQVGWVSARCSSNSSRQVMRAAAAQGEREIQGPSDRGLVEVEAKPWRAEARTAWRACFPRCCRRNKCVCLVWCPLGIVHVLLDLVEAQGSVASITWNRACLRQVGVN